MSTLDLKEVLNIPALVKELEVARTSLAVATANLDKLVNKSSDVSIALFDRVVQVVGMENRTWLYVVNPGMQKLHEALIAVQRDIVLLRKSAVEGLEFRLRKAVKKTVDGQ